MAYKHGDEENKKIGFLKNVLLQGHGANLETNICLWKDCMVEICFRNNPASASAIFNITYFINLGKKLDHILLIKYFLVFNWRVRQEFPDEQMALLVAEVTPN